MYSLKLPDVELLLRPSVKVIDRVYKPVPLACEIVPLRAPVVVLTERPVAALIVEFVMVLACCSTVLLTPLTASLSVATTGRMLLLPSVVAMAVPAKTV
ncbi:hypothetical protein K6V96_06270 [Streptococcus suis]|uniref:hypothetical protein n=1 Tax=Streptococcus suis TaxID=1307 RepID=UPI000C18D6EC|nr:hypothetical protein [Streptococcus suis]MBY4955747.1 hypothetical protein [Streptococcus suis]MBY4961282.1 hypothetical protein [Streptococcus suis]MBY4967606.1 hypothetical protein [Streptococcus suis]MBY4978681.1 hypothetical protein [Streptococcus suis]MBY4987189.1 hypothetical protein [Streptococcus suis]